jgi:hypothetical protein
MSTAQQSYYTRLSMVTTQFIRTLDDLRNLKREGDALDYINPALVPTGTAEAPLTPEQQALADAMTDAINAFTVFTEQGIFAEITGPQKDRAKKLYRLVKSAFVIQG